MAEPSQLVPTFIDTHTHLDDHAFDDDRDEVIAAALSVGVSRMINVGYSPSRWPTTAALQRCNPTITAMYGLHPQEADKWSDDVMNELKSYLDLPGTSAIGEIGLDYLRPAPTAAVQQAALSAQVSLAMEVRLPIVTHQRAAESDLISALSAYSSLPPVVLHSFDGSDRLADYAIERGWYIGIGGLATRRSSDHLRRVLTRVPVDRLLLETDSPYLSPAGSRLRRNTPGQIPLIARLLSPLWDMSEAELAQVTTEAAQRALLSRLGRADRVAAP